ncbi:MAG: DUF6588 family protein [bacterium]
MKRRDSMTFRQLLLFVAILAAGGFYSRPATAGDLNDLIMQVNQEYAEAYLAPLFTAYGINQNSGLYSTASIPKVRITIAFGLKITATKISDDRRNFRKTMNVTLDERYGFSEGDDGFGETARIIMVGPTVFGDDEDPGYIQIDPDNYPALAPQATIPGMTDTPYVPMIVPEASVGGIAGLRATVRWFPSISQPGVPKVNFLGYGLQYSVTNHLPDFPVDVMVGFFHTNLSMDGVLDASSNSCFLAASKSAVILTVYGGFAVEKSTMDIDYTFRPESGPPVAVSFSEKSEQKARVTIGAGVNMGLKLNLEASFGKMTNYTAGVMFGF